MTDAIGSALRRLSGPRGWIAIAGFALLWTALGIDIVLWLLRLSGGYSSKANLLSHFWPYLSFGGALAGLLARGMPNSLRSIPTVWLLVSLAIVHGNQFIPKADLPPPRGATVRVMTLNLGGAPGTRRRAIRYLRQRRNVDILFLQEVRGGPGFRDRSELEAALGRRFPGRAWFKGAPENQFRLGLGIMSRFPLREIRTLQLPSGKTRTGRCRQAAALTAKAWVRGRQVRLVTAHLCPPAIPWEDAWGRPVGLSFGTVADWLASLREYEYARRSQIRFLRALAEGGVEPLILAGDLNTTPASLDILELSGPLKNAYTARGMGFGFTYSLWSLGARLDHVFFSDGIAARSASIADVDISDHKPLEAVLEILPKGQARPPSR
jgi:endonuclease/exonuclease/phosphatase family metal-dependent hydrolase